MRLKSLRFDLTLARRWAISSTHGPGGGGGTDAFKVVFVELTDESGITGLGESAPSNRYAETADTVQAFLAKVDPARLSFTNLASSLAYLESLSADDHAAKCALDIALVDGAARLAGVPVHDFLGLGFTEGRHVTSFSIGIDTPDVIREKVAEAAHYPILKLKVGSADDRANLAALRDAAPTKPVRVDANEAWRTKEDALRQLEWLAADGHIQFVEQPMPADTDPRDLAWLKARSPLPLMADEGYRGADWAGRVAEGYHAVNVKLVKMGGITPAKAALEAARREGLKTMLGCMIESSILISAAAHLAELTDYLDIDGNILTTNDPFEGLTSVNGLVSFAGAKEKSGLRVRSRSRRL